MKKAILTLLATLCVCARALSAPTDIVPEGSALNDAFGTLALHGLLPPAYTPADFSGRTLYTRQQLAALLEPLLNDDSDTLPKALDDASTASSLRAALWELRPELDADNAAPDLDATLAEARPGGASLGGWIKPQLRLHLGGDSQPNTGVIGLYRATALGDLGSDGRFVLSASNWPQENRRVYNNDVGAHDFSSLNEAYLEARGRHGLTLDIGRLYDRWGPGYRGATMLSDNAPAFDQLKVAFPFSLGARFGRNYRFTQMATTFQENNQRKYFEARRLEYAFSPAFNVDVEEAFKSVSSRSLLVTVLPDFYSAQSFKAGGLRISGLDEGFNSFVNLGASYAADPNLRLYGQFGIDDIQSPGRQSYRTPRKIAYLIGTAFQPAAGTSVVAEYTFADPTTYSSRIAATQWQKGMFDQIGLPSGPNSREIFVHLGQKLSPSLSVSLEDRDRRRHDDSFPAPTSNALAASAFYSLSPQHGIELTFHEYHQDAYTFTPGTPGHAGDGFTPVSEGNIGQNYRRRELDVSYQFSF